MPQDNPNQQVTIEEWEEKVRDHFQIPRGLWQGMSSQESGGKWDAVSPTGVRGKYQVTEKTAKGYGLDRNDPYQQVVAAARTLRDNYDRLGDLKDDRARWLGSVGRYYAGDGGVDNQGNLGTKSPDGVSNPATHVERVARLWGDYEKQAGGQAPLAVPQAPQAPAPDAAPIVPAKPFTRPAKPVMRNPQRGPIVTPMQRQAQDAAANPFSFTQPTLAQGQAQAINARTQRISPDVAARADAAGRELGQYQQKGTLGKVGYDLKTGYQSAANTLADQVSNLGEVAGGIATGNFRPAMEQAEGAGRGLLKVASGLTPGGGAMRARQDQAIADVQQRQQARRANDPYWAGSQETQRNIEARKAVNPSLAAQTVRGGAEAAIGTLPIIAASAAGGGLPAVMGITAAQQDYTKPDDAMANLAGAYLSTKAGQAISPAAGALAQRLGGPAKLPTVPQEAIRRGIEGAAGGLTNTAQYAGTQLATGRPIDTQEAIVQGLTGGVMGTAMAPGRRATGEMLARDAGTRAVQAEAPGVMTRLNDLGTDARGNITGGRTPIRPDAPQQTQVTKIPTGAEYQRLTAEAAPQAPQAPAPAVADAPPQAAPSFAQDRLAGVRIIPEGSRVSPKDVRNVKAITIKDANGIPQTVQAVVPQGMTPAQARKILQEARNVEAAPQGQPGAPNQIPPTESLTPTSPRNKAISRGREIEQQARAEADAALQEGRIDDARAALKRRLAALQDTRNNVGRGTPGGTAVRSQLGEQIFRTQEELRGLNQRVRTQGRTPRAATPRVDENAPTRDLSAPLTPDAPRTAQIEPQGTPATRIPMEFLQEAGMKPDALPLTEPTNRLREADYPGGEVPRTAGLRPEGQPVEIPAERMQENTNRLPGAEYAGGEVRRGATGPMEGQPVETSPRQVRPPAPPRPAGGRNVERGPNQYGPTTMSAAFPRSRRGLVVEGRRVQGEIEAGRGDKGEFGKLAQSMFKSTSGDVAHGQDSFFHDPDVKGALGLSRDAEQGEVRAALKSELARVMGVKSEEVSLTQVPPQAWQNWAGMKQLGGMAKAKLQAAIQKYQKPILDELQKTITPTDSEPSGPVSTDRGSTPKATSDFQRFRDANAKVIASLNSITPAEAGTPAGKARFNAAVTRLRKNAEQMGVEQRHIDAIVTDAQNVQMEAARRADEAPRPVKATPAQEAPKAAARFADGDRVDIAGAQFDVVRANADGTVTLRNDQGDTWQEDPSASWRKVDAPVKRATTSEAPESSRRSVYIEARQREQLEAARSGLTKARQAIQEHLQKTGVKLPVGISAEQYVNARVGESKRPNKDLTALKRQLDAAQESVARAERELADTKGGIGSTRYTHGEVHRRMVESAIAKGKPVPAEVLADYPDLAPKAPDAPPVAETRPRAVSEAEAAPIAAGDAGKAAPKAKRAAKAAKEAPQEAAPIEDFGEVRKGRNFYAITLHGRENPHHVAAKSASGSRTQEAVRRERTFSTESGARKFLEKLYRQAQREGALPQRETLPKYGEVLAYPPDPKSANMRMIKTADGRRFYIDTEESLKTKAGGPSVDIEQIKRNMEAERAKQAAPETVKESLTVESPAKSAGKIAGKIDGKDVTADEMAVYDALAKVEPRISEGAAVSLTQARAEAGLSKEAFDKAALSLASKEVLALHATDFPQSLSPEGRAHLVQGKDAEYIAAALRTPGAKVEKAGARAEIVAPKTEPVLPGLEKLREGYEREATERDQYASEWEEKRGTGRTPDNERLQAETARERARAIQEGRHSILTPTAEENAAVTAKSSTQKEKPNIGLTPAQTTYLQNKVGEVKPRLEADGSRAVTIRVPDDGQFTVRTPGEADKLMERIGKPIVSTKRPAKLAQPPTDANVPAELNEDRDIEGAFPVDRVEAMRWGGNHTSSKTWATDGHLAIRAESAPPKQREALLKPPKLDNRRALNVEGVESLIAKEVRNLTGEKGQPAQIAERAVIVRNDTNQYAIIKGERGNPAIVDAQKLRLIHDSVSYDEVRIASESPGSHPIGFFKGGELQALLMPMRIKGEEADNITRMATGGHEEAPSAKAKPARKPRAKGSVGKLDRKESGGPVVGSGFGALQGMFKSKQPTRAEINEWMTRIGRAMPDTMTEAQMDRVDSLANRAADAAEAGNLAEWNRLRRQTERTVFSRKDRVIAEVSGAMNATRSMMASGDLSAPLRQGAILTLPPTQWGRAGRAGVRMLQAISAKKYDRLRQEIQIHPDFDAAEEAGLYLATNDNARVRGEEDFLRNNSLASRLTERLPFLSHSERAYKMYLDSLRIDTFAKYRQVIEKGSGTPEQKEKAIKAAAEWINVATGRGSLGKTFDEAVPMLSKIFFAPRYTASRIQVLNPATYAKNLGNPANRRVFRQQMSEMFQSAAILTTTAALAKYGLGATVELDDPDSPDWLKIKVGNTRYDVGAGLQQIARLGVRIGRYLDTSARGSAAQQGEASDKMVRAVKTFGRSKLAPVPSFFVDWLNNWTNVIGERHTPGDTSMKNPVVSRVTPLIWADMVDAYQTGGAGKAARFTPGVFGVGVQDYDVNKKRKATGQAQSTPARRPALPPPLARKPKGFGDL